MDDIFSAFSDPLSIWQLIGWAAVPIYIFSYQVLNPRRTILVQLPADILYLVHFWGLGAVLPMMISLASLPRNLAAVYGTKRQLHIVLALFVVYIWLCTAFLAEDWMDLAPAIGSSFLAGAVFFRDRFWPYRLCMAGFQIFWFSFFMIIGSYPGVFLISLTFSSNVIGMGRYVFRRL